MCTSGCVIAPGYMPSLTGHGPRLHKARYTRPGLVPLHRSQWPPAPLNAWWLEKHYRSSLNSRQGRCKVRDVQGPKKGRGGAERAKGCVCDASAGCWVLGAREKRLGWWPMQSWGK